MILKCQVVIMNRLAPGQDTRQCHCTLILGKKRNTRKSGDEVFFTLHTVKNKSGTKYLILKNILKVHNRFVDEGKCTLSVVEPPHDLAISKANVSELKKFLHIMRLVLKGQSDSIANELSLLTDVKNKDLEKPKTSMKICTRKDYPLKSSFPDLLENLNIHDCALKVFDRRILKLCHLKVLDLSHNKLNALCDSLDNLESLRCLILSNNNFTIFPSCILRGNTASRLRTLDLSHNNLTYIPATIIQVKNLCSIKLCSNKLQMLPSSIAILQYLQRFECSNNQLKYLPWSFTQLKLDFLDLDGNPLCEISPGVLEKNKDRINELLSASFSLFDITCRYVMKTRLHIDRLMPRHIIQALENVTYCPCGEPCFTRGLPIVKLFDICKISSSVRYSELAPDIGKTLVNVVTRLCSRKCYQNYTMRKH